MQKKFLKSILCQHTHIFQRKSTKPLETDARSFFTPPIHRTQEVGIIFFLFHVKKCRKKQIFPDVLGGVHVHAFCLFIYFMEALIEEKNENTTRQAFCNLHNIYDIK